MEYQTRLGSGTLAQGESIVFPEQWDVDAQAGSLYVEARWVTTYSGRVKDSWSGTLTRSVTCETTTTTVPETTTTLPPTTTTVPPTTTTVPPTTTTVPPTTTTLPPTTTTVPETTTTTVPETTTTTFSCGPESQLWNPATQDCRHVFTGVNSYRLALMAKIGLSMLAFGFIFLGWAVTAGDNAKRSS